MIRSFTLLALFLIASHNVNSQEYYNKNIFGFATSNTFTYFDVSDNEFKDKIHNLVGIDPYNDKADFEVGTLQYKTDKLFDVILCLGSVNFGSKEKIIAEVSRCVQLLSNNGLMFFRVNPGLSHDKPEADWIEFFAWNVPFIIELSEMFNLKILDIRDDTNQRKYFIYRKVK